MDLSINQQAPKSTKNKMSATEEITKDLNESLVLEDKRGNGEIKVDKDELYVRTQCYTNQELKKLIEEDGILGKGGKILTAVWAAKNAKLQVTVRFPDTTEKIFPLKASSYNGKTYTNKRSVAFFAAKVAGPSTDDFGELVSQP